MTTMDDDFNDKHKKQAILCSCPSPNQDLKQLDSAKEEQDATTLGEILLEDCITDIVSHQPPELAASCPRLRTLFHWNKCFEVWKKLSINHQPSPTCVPNNTRSSFVNFSLSELRKATNKFRNENLIGRGGFADVYKGCLKDGQLIAVKRLNRGTQDERISSFLSELGIMAHVNHHNTAKLIGFGVEGGMHLVFQLSPLGDLGSLLHGSNNANLDWSKRYKIIIGIADGLLYLHENCPRRIIHRDIKAENILLTENFEPQICDFGLAKWLPEPCTHFNVSKFEGTFGYFAPEYLMHGVVDEKTDAYSFGILLLEIITGRRALDRLQESIVSWAKPLYEANNIRDLVDPSLGDNYDREQMDRVVLTASLCVEQFPILRPSMSQVAILLRGDDFLQEVGFEIVQEHNAIS